MYVCANTRLCVPTDPRLSLPNERTSPPSLRRACAPEDEHIRVPSFSNSPQPGNANVNVTVDNHNIPKVTLRLRFQGCRLFAKNSRLEPGTRGPGTRTQRDIRSGTRAEATRDAVSVNPTVPPWACALIRGVCAGPCPDRLPVQGMSVACCVPDSSRSQFSCRDKQSLQQTQDQRERRLRAPAACDPRGLKPRGGGRFVLGWAG